MTGSISRGALERGRVVYGIHPVEEALARRGRDVKTLLVADRRRVAAAVARAEGLQIPVTLTTPLELDALCEGTGHQGIAALVGEYPYAELHDLIDGDEHAPLLVVADCLMDPQNLGSIIRSALVLGATGLVLPKDRSVRVTPTVVRVSAGASEHLRCAQVTNLARALGELKEAGLWIAGAVERGGTHPADADLRGPLALVVGNEHKGLRPLVRRQCDLELTIPARGGIASLNVAAATTALLYEVARQRRAGEE